MNDLVIVKEISEKWNITPRRVQKMCAEGKILGTVKVGRDWVILVNAPFCLCGKTGGSTQLDPPKYYFCAVSNSFATSSSRSLIGRCCGQAFSHLPHLIQSEALPLCTVWTLL